MKILNQKNVINYKGKEYEVFVDLSLIDKMNWSWESLIFPDNLETFAYVKDLENGNKTILTTEGHVSVFKDGEILDSYKIRQSALDGSIYNNEYTINFNNWFSINHYIKEKESNKLVLLQDEGYEHHADSVKGLIDDILYYHTEFFSNN